MASAPLVRAASRALAHASDIVARTMAVRCLQRLPIPLEGTLLSSLGDVNTLAICHAMGPLAIATLLCGEDLDRELVRWGYESARDELAFLLRTVDLPCPVTNPPGSLVDKAGENGVPRVFILLHEQPLAESWTLAGRFESKNGKHLLLKGDGLAYATLGLLSRPAYYVLAGSERRPVMGGPPDLESLVMGDEATYSTDGWKRGISIVHKVMELTSRAFEEYDRPAVISAGWLRCRLMGGKVVESEADTPSYTSLSIVEGIWEMDLDARVALATVERLFLTWVGSASSVRTIRHGRGDGLVSSCIGANCGVRTAAVLPGLRQSMINVYPSEHGIKAVYLPGFNTAVILPGTGQKPKVERELQFVLPKGESGGMLLPFMISVIKSGVLRESTKPACRTLVKEIGEDILRVLSPVSEGLVRALRETRLPRLSECFQRNQDLSEAQVTSVMQWLGVRWFEGPAGDFTCALTNTRIAHGYYRSSSLSCVVDCPPNYEGSMVSTLSDGRIGLVAGYYRGGAKILPLVAPGGCYVLGGIDQLRSDVVYHCTSWEPGLVSSSKVIERPLYVGHPRGEAVWHGSGWGACKARHDPLLAELLSVARGSPESVRK